MKTTSIMALFLITVFLLSCPKSSGPSFPWGEQPHLRVAGTAVGIPPVVGRWFGNPTITIGYDSTVYNATGDTSVIPGYISELATADLKQSIAEFIPYCSSNFNLKHTTSQTNPMILFKFYYGPWTVKGVSSDSGIVYPEFRDVVVLVEEGSKSASSNTNPPPTKENNYLGLAWISAKNKAHQGAVIWINVFVYEDMKRQSESHPELNIDWRKLAQRIENGVHFHELFHPVGLNDDPVGTAAGLMVYRNRLPRLSGNEMDVCTWLYPPLTALILVPNVSTTIFAPQIFTTQVYASQST